MTHLQRLEAKSLDIMREAVSESEKPVMLYAIGKDSWMMLQLAMKRFYLSKPPFPLLHVDITWKFREMYIFWDTMTKRLGLELIGHVNPKALAMNIIPFAHGSAVHADIWKTQGPTQALDKYGFDAAFGGARRDEEKSRAKEHIFSFRSARTRCNPKLQRPELWRPYNARKNKGRQHARLPALQVDRTRHLAVHLSGGEPNCSAVFQQQPFCQLPPAVLFRGNGDRREIYQLSIQTCSVVPGSINFA